MPPDGPTVEYRRRGREVLFQVEQITDGELVEVALGLLARVVGLPEVSRLLEAAPVGQSVLQLTGERIAVQRTEGASDGGRHAT
jgi:hypothetical protein